MQQRSISSVPQVIQPLDKAQILGAPLALHGLGQGPSPGWGGRRESVCQAVLTPERVAEAQTGSTDGVDPRGSLRDSVIKGRPGSGVEPRSQTASQSASVPHFS